MKSLARHDTLIAIAGTGILTIAFCWGVVLPGQTAVKKIEAEIAQAQARLGEIPVRMAELEQLRKRLDQKLETIDVIELSLPEESHVSDVLHQVASEARRSGLTITRLEPLPSSEYASYSAHPFHLSCRGTFADLSGFLNGLEAQERLVTFGSVDLLRGNDAGPSESGPRLIQANVNFNVYSRHAKTTKVAENTISRRSSASDN
jgi:Tfp pilus assembly protein PilO